jgi:hypothetical protein
LDHSHWPPNLKRSKVTDARLLQACVHVFLIVTRSVSAAVIITLLKIQSAMEITKCSDSSQTNFQYFDHGYSKSSFSFWVLLQSICNYPISIFNWVRPSKYCWLLSKPLTVVCWHYAAFLSCQNIIYSPARIKMDAR